MIENPPPGEGEEWVKVWKDLTPRGKFALPKELGDFVAVMCSDRAGSHTTGAEFTIDGGEHFDKTPTLEQKLMGRLHNLVNWATRA